MESTESKLAYRPNREKLIETARKTSFYGIACGELSRDDLLMVVGFLSEMNRQEREKRENEAKLLRELGSSRFTSRLYGLLLFGRNKRKGAGK